MKNGNGSTSNKLSKSVLILTKAYMPVEITTVKNGMTLLCTGKAKVVDHNYQTYTLEEWMEKNREQQELDNSVIRTVKSRIEIPDVLILTEMSKPPKYNIKFSYQNILTRDNFICQYCYEPFDKKNLTVDHIIPRSKGGKSTWENCAAACFSCNTKKADKSLKEAGMKLLKEPKKPQGMFRLRYRCKQVDRWKQFV